MAFCPHCGVQVPAGARFCANCGTQVAVSVGTAYAAQTAVNDASVMLVSLGTCSALTAANMLEDVCGYSDEEARLMVVSAPITVAQNLSAQQANVLAQAMTEYGMEVSVYNNAGYVNTTASNRSVFSNDGNILAEAAAILGMISVGNRINRSMMRRWDYPYGRPVVYRTVVPRRPAPPRRQRVRVAPPPPPPMHVGPAPRPASPRPASPRPAAPRGGKPMGPVGPMGPGGPRGPRGPRGGGMGGGPFGPR